jgi:hypothetical protein
VTSNKAKAWAGGAVATVLAFLTGLSTSLDGGVTETEWVTIAIATITSGAAAFGVVWRVPNAESTAGSDVV